MPITSDGQGNISDTLSLPTPSQDYTYPLLTVTVIGVAAVFGYVIYRM